MCGLFGCITKRDFNLDKRDSNIRNSIIKGLAIAMEDRGSHSTGIAGIDDKHYSIKKEAKRASEFVEGKQFKSVIDKNYPILIGHTRLATVGAVSDKNAHPFQFGDIIGAHNGHVTNWLQVNSELDVDSEAIFYLLDKNNNDYKKSFKELYGNFAITWFDIKQPHRIHLVVDGNPLNLVYVHDLKTYFYASEEYPLQGVVGSYFDLPKQKVWKPESSKVYTISTRHEIKKNDVEFSKQYPYHSGENYGHNYDHNMPYTENDIEEWFRDREEEEYNKEHGYNFASTHIPSYKERHGVENPYKQMEKEEQDEKDQIKRLSYSDMYYIRECVEEKGCNFCKHNIDILSDEGFYWYKVGKGRHVICAECVETGDYGVRRSQLIFVEGEDYTEMMNEVDAFELKAEEAKKKNDSRKN